MNYGGKKDGEYRETDIRETRRRREREKERARERERERGRARERERDGLGWVGSG